MAIDITALYCCLDDFCKVFEDWEAHRLIPSQTIRRRTGKLSRSEMLFIMVLFHLSPFKHFKVFSSSSSQTRRHVLKGRSAAPSGPGIRKSGSRSGAARHKRCAPRTGLGQ